MNRDPLSSATRQPEPYALYWLSKPSHGGLVVWHWNVTFSRQRRRVLRSFTEQIYGNKEAAFVMAKTYRDAALCLLSPQTVRQQSSRPTTSNKSGLVGVRRFTRGDTSYWQATFADAQRKNHNRSFSIKRCGEEQAKALAVAARAEFLQNAYPDVFVVRAPDALTQAETMFAHVLEASAPADAQPAPRLDRANADRLIGELDAWFARLRPRFVDVKIVARQLQNGQVIDVAVTDSGLPASRKSHTLRVGQRGWDATLSVAWEFIERALIAQHDEACWTAFRHHHREAFFGFEHAFGFRVRYRQDAPDDAQRRQPPESLRALLPGFEIPALPLDLAAPPRS